MEYLPRRPFAATRDGVGEVAGDIINNAEGVADELRAELASVTADRDDLARTLVELDERLKIMRQQYSKLKRDLTRQVNATNAATLRADISDKRAERIADERCDALTRADANADARDTLAERCDQWAKDNESISGLLFEARAQRDELAAPLAEARGRLARIDALPAARLARWVRDRIGGPA